MSKIKIQSKEIQLSYYEKMRRDFISTRFTRLVVAEYIRSNRCHSYWRVICDCGNQKIVTKNSLRRGAIKSCGCYKNDILVKNNTKHNMSYSKIYKVWASIKSRCLNHSCKNYKNYGGRGISLQESWVDFENFYNDFGKHWSIGMTVERVNNNDSYSKENCKWVSMVDNQQNKRNTRLINYNGETKTAAYFFRKHGIPKTSGYDLIKSGVEIGEIVKRFNNEI